ncbi:MAG: metalloregulator ArsR/SmtB family transcription factor [Pseudomonadota bacterium]
MNEVYRALAHPARRKILSLVKQRAHAAGELAEALDIANSTLSGHLNTLKMADLVTMDRQGTTLLYRANLSVMEEAFAELIELFGKLETEPTTTKGENPAS